MLFSIKRYKYKKNTFFFQNKIMKNIKLKQFKKIKNELLKSKIITINLRDFSKYQNKIVFRNIFKLAIIILKLSEKYKEIL